jgi:SAM-dependent methyltransferase
MKLFEKIRSRLGPVPQGSYVGDYMADYGRHTDLRVKRDPHEAVGGLWEEIGELQFQFLKSEGLKPSDTLLDIGCGTLRGGRHFVRYLENGNYTGTEMSKLAVKEADRLVARENLLGKKPTIIHVPDGNLRFDGLKKFDFILAQSVFTHLKERLIEECFANIAKVFGSRFYFTFFEADTPTARSNKDFAYPFAYFKRVASENGLKVENLSSRYHHPRTQKMGLATRRR